MGERQVLHINVANFMARVEELCDSSLRGRPFAVASRRSGRSVILDVSEKAYQEGLRRGFPLRTAGKIKGVRIIEPRYDLYSLACKKLHRLVIPRAPAVERVSGGHFFLDITGTGKLFGNPVDYAARIRREIGESLNILPIVGVASNRLVSKVATRVVKPDGFASIMTGDEESFLRHQEIALLPGIGEKLLERMHLLGIHEVGALAELSDSHLIAALGRKGYRIRDFARGIDSTPVESLPVSLKKIREERTLDSDTGDPGEMEAHLFMLAEETGLKLRQGNMLAEGVEVKVIYTDGISVKGQERLEGPSALDGDFFDASRRVLRRIITRRVRMRKVSLSLTRLREGDVQLDLFLPGDEIKRRSLQASIDSIRSRFGRKALEAGIVYRCREGG